MNKYQEIYQSKLKSPEQIAEYFASNFTCFSSCALGEPISLIKAVSEYALKKGLTNITHHVTLGRPDARNLAADLAGKYYQVAWFSSAGVRSGIAEGRHDYMPAYFNEMPLFWDNYLSPDVFYCTVSPMDKHGYFSLGLSAAESAVPMAKARYRFLEVNPHMPRIFGDHLIHISEVDALCECNDPLPEIANPAVSESDRIIGALIAEEVPNGATIQLGIGSIPSAVGKALLHKKDLGIHTELFVDSMLDLIEAGVVTNKKKNINRGKSIATFCQGTRRLYDYLDDNLAVEFRRVDYVNNPAVIGAHDNFVSVNSCLEVDLLGQVCSESIGSGHYSGTGGQVDFVRGCTLSKGGQSFIAIHSTAKGGTMTKIKPVLTEGAVVTTSKNEVDKIVTEYGIASLKGKTAGERAKALIAIAHPDFRAELTAAAKKMNLMI